MLIQFFGLDVDKRNKLSKEVSLRRGSFYCTDRELPMASLEAQFGRWLRTISGVCLRNSIDNIVLSGYFPTTEARQQFKENNDFNENMLTIWVDTINPEYAEEPKGHGETTDFKWEYPSKDEYDIRIDLSDFDAYDNLVDRLAVLTKGDIL
jgi:hypothetical protein